MTRRDVANRCWFVTTAEAPRISRKVLQLAFTSPRARLGQSNFLQQFGKRAAFFVRCLNAECKKRLPAAIV
jgi:hypothetical protein